MTLGRAPARRSAHAALALVLALSGASGGCSFYWTRPPPPPSTWPSPVLPDTSEAKCTKSLGPPVVDTIVFGILGPLAYIERDSITYEERANLDNSGQRKPAASGLRHFSPPAGELVAVPDHLARGIALTFGVAAVLAAASGVYGYLHGLRCRRYGELFHPPLE
jgi:hypothetical protein